MADWNNWRTQQGWILMPFEQFRVMLQMRSEVAMSSTVAVVVAILVMASVVGSANGTDTAEEQRVSRKEVKHLLATANTVAEYQRVATYFRNREDFYRAKAQAEMTEYARCVRNITMAPKFPTRADQAARLYEYYADKANRQAKRATHYEDLLIRSGVRPFARVQTVSVTGPATRAKYR